MNDSEAIKLVKEIFQLIKNAKSIAELEKIESDQRIFKNKMDIDSYPKIEFNIKESEIQFLIDKSEMIDKNFNFSKDITSKLTDPLSKLLYATAWKNGDLKKIKHIIKGIQDCDNENSNQDEALVFYQFGKYLTKRQGEPIIDQHVIRAFLIYKLDDKFQATEFRQIETINKNHKQTIEEYKKWLVSDELTQELRNQLDYSYFIDKLLFATGKSIKMKKPKKQKS
ncbi:MAG: hypothetical protein U5N85_14925 [Arcicella sp.]|nr:hypothetical protein [Arcicella sp.]